MVQYKCDDKCPQYKSVCICSHTIAAAELNQDLVDFLKWFQQNRGKKMPNLSGLGSHGMPAGAGRKGGKVAKKKVTRKCHPMDENRVPLDTTPQSSASGTRGVLSPVEYNIRVSAAGASSVSTHNTYSPATCDWQGYCSPSTGAAYPCYGDWHAYGNPSPSASTVYPPYTNLHPYAWPSTSYSPWPAPGTLPPQFSSPHPPPPPPTPHPPPISGSDGSDSGPYKVCFKIGNISVYNGCRNNFSKFDNIVIQHAEFRHFTSPRTGLPASKFGNAYYHASRRCIELKWGASFNFSSITVPDSVKPKLKSLQTFKIVHAYSLNRDNTEHEYIYLQSYNCYIIYTVVIRIEATPRIVAALK